MIEEKKFEIPDYLDYRKPESINKKEKDLIKLVKPLPTLDGNVDSIIHDILNPKTEEILSDPILDVKDYNEEDKRRIYIEEVERRKIEDERFLKIQEAFQDEIKRREMFREELKQMKIDFDIYLKKKYPDIVGEKSIRDKDIDKNKLIDRAIRKALKYLCLSS